MNRAFSIADAVAASAAVVACVDDCAVAGGEEGIMPR